MKVVLQPSTIPQATPPQAINLSVLGSNIESTPAWDAYVNNHPEGSVFHLQAWQRVIADTFRHPQFHVVARNAADASITGVLPLFLVRSRIFGRMLVSTPQAAYGGVLADSDSIAVRISGFAHRLAEELGVEFLELRNFHSSVPDPDLTARERYVTFRQDLRDPEVNLKLIPRKTRAEVRRGIQSGLEFRIDDIGVNEFFDLFSRSVRDLGTPVFPKRLFGVGKRMFGSNCKICSVHWQGKPVAAVWTLFYRHEVIPYFGGGLREYNRYSANNFMYYMLIKYGCEQGFRVFDFGRSKVGTGSYDFKKRWGMTMSPLPYQYALVRQKTLPDYSPGNPKFRLGVEMWRRLPLPVTQLLGPYVARHLI